MKRHWWLGLALLPGFFYLLPTQSLFDESLRQRQKVKSILVTWKTTLINEDLANGEVSFQEKAVIDMSGTMSIGKLRLDSDYQTVPRILVFNGQSVNELTVDGQLRTLSQLPKSEIWWLFYLCRETSTLVAKLNQFINSGTSPTDMQMEHRLLDRLGNRIVYSLGKDATAINRVWFDKEFMQPLGYTIAGTVTVRWDEMSPYNDDIYFPQQIIIYDANGKAVEKRQVQSVRINQPINIEQFSLTPTTGNPSAATRTEAAMDLAHEIEKIRASYNR